MCEKCAIRKEVCGDSAIVKLISDICVVDEKCAERRDGRLIEGAGGRGARTSLVWRFWRARRDAGAVIMSAWRHGLVTIIS